MTGRKIGNKKIGVHGTDAETGRNGDQRTTCPVTREQFKRAPAVTVQFVVDGQVVSSQTATPREFSTGSLGWYTGDKVTVPVDGVPCKCQVGCNLTVVSSRDLPK